MFCNKCGKENQDGSKFCLQCGNQFIEQPVQMNNQNSYVNQPINSMNNNVQNVSNNNSNMSVSNGQGNNNKTIIIIIVCIVGILLLFLGGKFVIEQIRLHNVDKELQDDAQNINGSLNNNQTEDKQENKKYNVGDAVTLLDDSKWHVISTNGNNVVLLSDTLAKESSGYGTTGSYEDQKYENSIVKKYIDEEYTPNLKSSLERNGGNTANLTVRIISVDEYLKLSGSKFYASEGETSECWNTNVAYYDLSDEDYSDVPMFLAMTDSYWTMDNYKDYTDGNSSCNYKGYHGAYYLEITKSSFDENSGRIQLNMDNNAIGTTSYGTFVGIRPVIETTVDNIK